MTRRVVITGLGLITPLGAGVDVTWKRLLAGESGAGRITAFDPTDYGCQVACEIPTVDGRGGGAPGQEGVFDPSLVLTNKERRKVDDFILYAIAAADEALNDADWHPENEDDQFRSGVLIGSGIGGLGVIADTASGSRIHCRRLVFATGYELPHGVAKRGHRLTSTWAIATVPDPARWCSPVCRRSRVR